MMSGIIEIKTPTTGIMPNTKTMMDNPATLGNPRNKKMMAERMALMKEIKICVWMTLPKELENFLPKVFKGVCFR